jgi:3-dehydroquinate synthetase
MVEALTRDKKVEGGALWLVAVRDIGDVVIRRTPLTELAALI